MRLVFPGLRCCDDRVIASPRCARPTAWTHAYGAFDSRDLTVTHLDSPGGPRVIAGSPQEGARQRWRCADGDRAQASMLEDARRATGQERGHLWKLDEAGRSRWGCLQRGRRPADTSVLAPYIRSGLPTSKTTVIIKLCRFRSATRCSSSRWLTQKCT